MLFVAISSTIVAIVAALASSGTDLVILAIAAGFLALASALVLWLSPSPIRLEWWNGVRALAFVLAILALVPAVITGLIWFFMWVVVPTIIIVPLIFGWELSEIETKPVHRLVPRHA